MRIHVTVGGFGGPWYSIESHDGQTMKYTFSQSGAPGDERTEEITPNDAQWDRFWGMVRGCKDWRRVYDDPEVLDGTQWKVAVTAGDIELRSRGSNAYPANWKAFLRAIRSLVGGRRFG